MNEESESLAAEYCTRILLSSDLTLFVAAVGHQDQSLKPMTVDVEIATVHMTST